MKILILIKEPPAHIQDVHSEASPKSIALCTGPEGGFTNEEIAVAKALGFQLVSLSPRILRADTAALAVLAALQNRWGDL